MSFSATRISGFAAVAMSLSIAIAPSSAYANNYTRTYKVEITNIMKASQFTPILAAVHTRNAEFFSLGDMASDGLAMIAETGDTSVLQAALEASDQVLGASTNGFPGDGPPLTFAGTTNEFTVEANVRYPRLSFAAMILPSNDSFVALNSVPLPRWGSRVYYALGYDSGSEINDEICANIPGPTCEGSGVFGVPGGGEGFVHIASGIQGHADVDAKKYDWNNPIAKVVITRMR